MRLLERPEVRRVLQADRHEEVVSAPDEPAVEEEVGPETSSRLPSVAGVRCQGWVEGLGSPSPD